MESGREVCESVLLYYGNYAMAELSIPSVISTGLLLSSLCSFQDILLSAVSVAGCNPILIT